jgi:hypothetical protein
MLLIYTVAETTRNGDFRFRAREDGYKHGAGRLNAR